LKLNKRGFSLIEVLSATVLITILSVFSVTQYNRHKTKSYTKEAQLQLGHLYRMEKTYFVEHSTFTYTLSGNLFPKGQLIYNVGFDHHTEDWKANPCADRGSLNSTNNYWELCGRHPEDRRKECWFKNEKTGQMHDATRHYVFIALPLTKYSGANPSHRTYGCYPNPSSRPDKAYTYYCNGSTLRNEFPDNDDKSYTKFIAYASGDILDPHSFSSDADKLDVWRINGNGYLEHCQDPVDKDPSDPDYNTCDDNMKYSNESGRNYC